MRYVRVAMITITITLCLTACGRPGVTRAGVNSTGIDPNSTDVAAISNSSNELAQPECENPLDIECQGPTQRFHGSSLTIYRGGGG